MSPSASFQKSVSPSSTMAEKIEREEGILSHHGSISGEIFVSRRSLRSCSILSNFRDSPDSSSCKGLRPPDGEARKQRLNNSFHHFRFLVVMLSGTAVGLMMLLRYNMTISILKMVNQTHLYLVEHPNKTVEEFLADGHSLGGEFNWNNEVVAIILSWYMFSYTLPQILAVRLATRLGCRLALPLSLSVCALASLLTPAAAHLGWHWVVLLRLLNGLGASAILPLMLHLVENWMRYDEISLGLTIGQLLNASFIALTPLITGYLAAIHWSYSFYAPALFTLAFCLVCLLLLADEPQTSRFMSEYELAYIMDEQPAGGPRQAPAADEKTRPALEQERLSWLAILRVPSFYAYVFMWCLNCSSYSGFVFILPAYLGQFLRVGVGENGLYCFLIQAGSMFAALWPLPLLKILQRLGFSMTAARRLAHLVCCSMVASSWLYVGQFHQDQLLFLFINRCFHGGNDVIVVGSLMSNYARAGLSSEAFALVNTLGNLSIVFTSTLIGWLLDYTGQSRAGWSCIYSALALAQLLMWLIFATSVRSEPIRFRRGPQQATESAQSGTSSRLS